MAENKWDYQELFFQEIDLAPLREGKPTRSFSYGKNDDQKKLGYVITILKGKKNPKKYYVKVELAVKQGESEPEAPQEEVPF